MACPARNVPYELAGGYATTHRCAIPQCKARIPKEFLMCHRHWQDVPKTLQDKVWRTWKRWRSGENGEGLREYQTAREEAIAYIANILK